MTIYSESEAPTMSTGDGLNITDIQFDSRYAEDISVKIV